jgi:tRNA-Thr(GGU) m(6)t(6)A37 methyltransferase TsaA
MDSVLTLTPIGRIARDATGVRLEVDAPFRPALLGLAHFSHVIALWWPDQLDPDWLAMLQSEPPYAPGHVMGVFATRAPYRPNPVALTVCPILEVDEAAGIVRVADIDALDGSPLFDLKAYVPVCDRVRAARIPAWLTDWPDWLPENGLGLE